MKELINDINSAYNMVSSIHVCGDTVDLMAAVRAKLRRVSETLTAMEQEEATGE